MKSMPLFAKVLIGVCTVASGAVIVVSGVQVYSAVSGDDDFDIASRIQDQLTDIKNEPMGCCLPHCGESGQTICEQSAGQSWIEASCASLGDECEIGVCYPYGDLTKAACTLVGGKNWYKGECKEGYNMKIDGVKKGTNEWGTKWTWEYSVTAYTCEEDLYNATWQGEWVWDWEAIGSDGEKGYDHEDGSMTFTTSDGQATYSMADTPVELELSTDTVDMKVSFEPLGVMNASGTVVRGDESCESE